MLENKKMREREELITEAEITQLSQELKELGGLSKLVGEIIKEMLSTKTGLKEIQEEAERLQKEVSLPNRTLIIAATLNVWRRREKGGDSE